MVFRLLALFFLILNQACPESNSSDLSQWAEWTLKALSKHCDMNTLKCGNVPNDINITDLCAVAPDRVPGCFRKTLVATAQDASNTSYLSPGIPKGWMDYFKVADLSKVEEPIHQAPLSATVISTTMPTTLVTLTRVNYDIEKRDVSGEDSRILPVTSSPTVTPNAMLSPQSSCPVCACNCPKCQLSDEMANPVLAQAVPAVPLAQASPIAQQPPVSFASSPFIASVPQTAGNPAGFPTNQAQAPSLSSSQVVQPQTTFNPTAWQQVKNRNPTNSLVQQMMRGALQDSGLGYLFNKDGTSVNPQNPTGK